MGKRINTTLNSIFFYLTMLVSMFASRLIIGMYYLKWVPILQLFVYHKILSKINFIQLFPSIFNTGIQLKKIKKPNLRFKYNYQLCYC